VHLAPLRTAVAANDLQLHHDLPLGAGFDCLSRLKRFPRLVAAGCDELPTLRLELAISAVDSVKKRVRLLAQARPVFEFLLQIGGPPPLLRLVRMSRARKG
jgi:hypothetical protein